LTITPESVLTLRPFSDGAEAVSENGRDFVRLPNLKVPSGNALHIRNALLCPGEMHNYPTRLFLSEPIPGRGQNWT
jgi:hypothetical protein